MIGKLTCTVIRGEPPVMRLVQAPGQVDGEPARDGRLAFVGTPLVVLFVDGSELQHLRAAGGGAIHRFEPLNVSEDDAYLLIPDDIGEEIVDILADGDDELLDEALTESVLVLGSLEGGRDRRLHVQHEITLATAFAENLPYAAEVALDGPGETLRRLNRLEHLQCTMVSTLVDAHGLEAVTTRDRYIGVGWRAPESVPGLQAIAPTYLYSRRLSEGVTGVELAFFVEDGDLTALFRPVKLRA